MKFKKGDKVFAKNDLVTEKVSFKKGQELQVTNTDVFGIDVVNPVDTTQWMTEVSPSQLEK